MKHLTAAELERLALASGGRVMRLAPAALRDWPPGHLSRERPVQAEPNGRHVLVLDDFIPPTLNRTMRGRIKDRCRLTKGSHDLIAAEAIRQGIPRATTARRVTIVVAFPKWRSRPDPDSPLKVLGDSLVQAGLLIDDDYAHVEWAPVVYHLGPARTDVILEDIPFKVVGPRP